MNLGVNAYTFLSKIKRFCCLKDREYTESETGIEITYNIWLSPIYKDKSEIQRVCVLMNRFSFRVFTYQS
jgi:hypothetical protein